jgi:hypothetical protein
MALASDRALRREVMRLARLKDDDLSAVLDGLNPSARQRIEGLLLELAREPVVATAAPPKRPQQFSPWLQDRLNGAVTGVSTHTHATLVECAALEAGRGADAPVQKPGDQSLFQQLLTGRSPRAGRA